MIILKQKKSYRKLLEGEGDSGKCNPEKTTVSQPRGGRG